MDKIEKVERVWDAANEPPAVRAYLFLHYPYTPGAWTFEEINYARLKSGLPGYVDEKRFINGEQ